MKDYILELEASKTAIDLFEIDLTEFVEKYNKEHPSNRLIATPVNVEEKEG